MTSTKVQWRVQVRKSRAHKWVNKGLFETRDSARYEAMALRIGWSANHWDPAYGFGNTRVQRYEKGAK
jgi:hypothetical protein